MRTQWIGYDIHGNRVAKGDPVRYLGERFRVLRSVNNKRDVVIQNVEGYRMTVGVNSVEVGW